MSANNPLGSIFNNLFGTTAAYNNAQYGKTGNAGIDFLRPGLDFMMGAYNAYQANPEGGGTAIAGLGNMVDGLGRRNFLNQQQQQAQAAMQYQQMVAAQKAADNRQYAHATSGLNVSGYQDLPSAEIFNQIRESNQAANNNKFLQGQPLKQADYGAIDPTLMKNYMDRFGAISDAATTQEQLGQYANQGQNRSFGEHLPNNITGPTDPGQPPLDPATGAINGGISETGPYVNPMFQSNPYGIGVPNIPNLLTAQGQGLTAAQDAETNARGVAQNKETARHNKASEATDRINANAHMVSAQHSGSAAPQMTDANAAYQMFMQGKMPLDQYMQRLGGSGANGVDTKTDYLKANLAATVSAYGKNSKQAIQAAQQLQDHIQYTLSPSNYQFTSPDYKNAVSGPFPTAGQGIQNVKSAGQNASQNLTGFAAWKSGKAK